MSDTPAPQSEAPQTQTPEQTTRDDVIRAALGASEPPGAQPPVETPPAPAPKPQAEAGAEQQATEHARRLAADRKLRERERMIAEREAKAAAAEEALNLLNTDPVAYAKKYGGEKFGQRYVSSVVADGKPDPMEHVKRLEGELQAEREQRAEAERTRMVADWRGAARQHATTNESLALRGFYDDAEIEDAAMEYAGRHYQAQDPDERRVLQPSETLGKMHEELVSRLTRLSKTTAGQQLLRSLVQQTTAAPPVEKRSESAAAAPRLTNQLDATPAPTRGQGGNVAAPSSNEDLLREALRSWQ